MIEREELFLAVLFRGLFQELTSTDGIAESLKLFLPYSVAYKEKDPQQPVIKLIPPEAIGVSFNDQSVATAFFDNTKNEKVIRRAMAKGRRNCALWKIIKKINSAADEAREPNAPRFFIHDGAKGDKTYREIAQQTVGDLSSEEQEDEYDIAGFGYLYPTLAVITQEDYRVIGAVSIDCSNQLELELARRFKAFAEEYRFLNAWQFNRCSIMDYYRMAPNRWGKSELNPFSIQENHTFKMIVERMSWDHFRAEQIDPALRSALEEGGYYAIQNLLSQLSAEEQFYVLKGMFGHETSCPALWQLLSMGSWSRRSSNTPFRLWCTSKEAVVALNIAIGYLLREEVFKESSVVVEKQAATITVQFRTMHRWDSSGCELAKKVAEIRSEVKGNLASYRPYNLRGSLALLCEALQEVWKTSPDTEAYRPLTSAMGYYILPTSSAPSYSDVHPLVVCAFDDAPWKEQDVDLSLEMRCPAGSI